MTLSTLAMPDQKSLFAVVFVVQPDPAHAQEYLQIASGLRQELIHMPGFVENERYRHTQQPEKLLSLSLWDSEKALVHWRTHPLHHDGQARGRAGVLQDYHLRVGEVTHCFSPHAQDRHVGWMRFDQTQVAQSTALLLLEGQLPDEQLEVVADQALACERYTHLTDPQRGVWLSSWPSHEYAHAFLSTHSSFIQERALNAYLIRVIRDYGMHDRREAPQYYPPATRSDTA